MKIDATQIVEVCFSHLNKGKVFFLTRTGRENGIPPGYGQYSHVLDLNTNPPCIIDYASCPVVWLTYSQAEAFRRSLLSLSQDKVPPDRLQEIGVSFEAASEA